MGRYGHLLWGSKAEVTSKEKGLLGSWFLVTVVTPPENPASRSKKKRMTLVEYDTLVNEDGTMLLREKVDSLLLRPVPPRTLGDRGFEVGDCVDAFEKDGWWTGVVERSVGVKKEGVEESYVMWFEESEVEVEFGRAELRLHLDWKDGKWYRLRDEDHQVECLSDHCLDFSLFH